MILFLYGKDTYLSQQQLKKMIEKFRADRDPSGLNVSVPDISKQEPEQILEEIQVSPFLAEKRMVVIKGLLASKQKKLQEMLLEKLKNQTFPASTIIVFWEEDGDFKSTNLVKELFALLQKEKYAQRFDMLTGAKLNQCIESEVKEMGASIAKSATVYLAQHSKADMWFVHNTLSQLRDFCEKREITLTDVQVFVPERFDDNVFNLVDAIVSGSGGAVFSMLEEQYKKGEDSMMIFGLLVRQFRILLLLRDVLDRGIPLGDGLAKELGLHPFVVKKSLPFAKKYSKQKLEKIYTSLLEIDKKTKLGGGDQAVLLDVFISQLCLK